MLKPIKMLYDEDIFFFRGLTGEIKLYNEEKWQFSLLEKYRISNSLETTILRASYLIAGSTTKYLIFI